MALEADVVIVGAGLAGLVAAAELADAGRRVTVIDRRPHIGGNAYDEFDEHGILIHPYGPHIFHTNAKRVFEYLSRFTDWRFYEHRVLAQVPDNFDSGRRCVLVAPASGAPARAARLGGEPAVDDL